MERVFEPGVATMSAHSDILKNSQKLFNYLVCLAGNPPNTQKRVFQHKNVNISQIYRTIGISTNSIKKYWCDLERNGKIVYGNNGQCPEEEAELLNQLLNGRTTYELTEKEYFDIWKQLWTARKSRPCEYYEVRAGCKNRKIPTETLKILNEALKITEQDMKLYQFLLTYREVGIKKMYKTFNFSMMDLRNFLEKRKEKKTHISIYKSLLLLKEYGLINFEERYELNSRNVKIKHYLLTDVSFYVKDSVRNCEEEERAYIDQTIKAEIDAFINEEYSDEEF